MGPIEFLRRAFRVRRSVIFTNVSPASSAGQRMMRMHILAPGGGFTDKEVTILAEAAPSLEARLQEVGALLVGSSPDGRVYELALLRDDVSAETVTMAAARWFDLAMQRAASSLEVVDGPVWRIDPWDGHGG